MLLGPLRLPLSLCRCHHGMLDTSLGLQTSLGPLMPAAEDVETQLGSRVLEHALVPSCGEAILLGPPGGVALRAPQSPCWGSPSWPFGWRQQACVHFICTSPLAARG